MRQFPLVIFRVIHIRKDFGGRNSQLLDIIRVGSQEAAKTFVIIPRQDLFAVSGGEKQRMAAFALEAGNENPGVLLAEDVDQVIDESGRDGGLIAQSHHEKWDGTGYPRGLKGEEIPVTARICAIADVFDALISKRVYKEEWDEKEVLRHIEEQSGKHFDPEVVDAFVSVYEVITAIRSKYKD